MAEKKSWLDKVRDKVKEYLKKKRDEYIKKPKEELEKLEYSDKEVQRLKNRARERDQISAVMEELNKRKKQK
jgi:hypothetical protein